MGHKPRFFLILISEISLKREQRSISEASKKKKCTVWAISPMVTQCIVMVIRLGGTRKSVSIAHCLHCRFGWSHKSSRWLPKALSHWKGTISTWATRRRSSVLSWEAQEPSSQKFVILFVLYLPTASRHPQPVVEGDPPKGDWPLRLHPPIHFSSVPIYMWPMESPDKC